MFIRKSIAAAIGAAAFVCSTFSAQAAPVDLELQLLVDVSGSVSGGEFALQQQGYSDAFRDSGIQDAIDSGAIGSIAVQLVFWSSAGNQQIAIDWTEVTGATSDSFADLIDAATRPFFGGTAPGSALNFGAPLFNGNGFEGDRLVIDVSGDGAQNDGPSTSAARDAALASGIDAINGIIIEGEPGLEAFYQANIVGGVGGFLEIAASFADFSAAVRRKLGREITGVVPVPGALLLMLTGLGGIRLAGRKKAA